MTDHKTVNIKSGSKLDEAIEALIADDEMLESYSQTGRYLMRQGLQQEENAD